MDGILILDKPAGITSHDVVARVRRVLKTKRIGHTGTLDPFATGVMVVLVGKATRLAQFLERDEKEYEALVQFGFETDTGDVTGSRTADCGMRNEEVAVMLAHLDWSTVLQRFRGAIQQVPPMYSAKKVDGKKLYELARKGIELERRPVEIRIRELEILPPAYGDPPAAVRIRVACSAGTYIRTLAEDIGRTVGLGAHLTELRRVRSGRFAIDESVALDRFASDDRPEAFLRPARGAVAHLNVVELNSDRVAKTLHGLPTRDLTERFADGEMIQMLDPSGQLIAIGRFDGGKKEVQPKAVLG